ncbi:hypothetical protein KC356_g159 [Hortaea werneckii]|nr:hypothetical protein KC356_g159 [Hortaea werneckii]
MSKATTLNLARQLSRSPTSSMNSLNSAERSWRQRLMPIGLVAQTWQRVLWGICGLQSDLQVTQNVNLLGELLLGLPSFGVLGKTTEELQDFTQISKRTISSGGIVPRLERPKSSDGSYSRSERPAWALPVATTPEASRHTSVPVDCAADTRVSAGSHHCRAAASRMTKNGNAVDRERARSTRWDQLVHGGHIAQLVDDKGSILSAGNQVPGRALQNGRVRVDCVAVWVGDDIGIVGMVDSDDREKRRIGASSSGEHVLVWLWHTGRRASRKRAVLFGMYWTGTCPRGPFGGFPLDDRTTTAGCSARSK